MFSAFPACRELSELLCRIEARALFYPFFRFYLAVTVQVRREVTMSAHPAAGESLLQLPDELPERGPLCRSPGICRASPAVQTTFITDAYRVSVEVFRMGSDAFEGTGEVTWSKASGESVESSRVALQCTTIKLIIRIRQWIIVSLVKSV